MIYSRNNCQQNRPRKPPNILGKVTCIVVHFSEDGQPISEKDRLLVKTINLTNRKKSLKYIFPIRQVYLE